MLGLALAMAWFTFRLVLGGALFILAFLLLPTDIVLVVEGAWLVFVVLDGWLYAGPLMLERAKTAKLAELGDLISILDDVGFHISKRVMAIGKSASRED